jgi:membrane-anchored mycosin MYCP
VPVGHVPARGLLCAGLVAAGLTFPVVPAAHAEGEDLCSDIQADARDVDEVQAPSAPREELRIEEATDLLARKGRAPGQGIGVAVVDSGIAGSNVNVVDSVRNPEFSKSGSVAFYHGTAVAGLIAGRPRPDGGGPVGIAPAASVYDVRVYDAPDDSDDGELAGLTDAGVIDGLNRVADSVAAGVPIRIVNVSLALRHSDALEEVIGRLADLGVVVVAASGNRPEDESDPVLGDFAGEPLPGEDAARVVHPARYESVVAASASVPRGEDARDFIVQNSATDIAAPTIDGVSYALNGVSCLLDSEAATSWAAAEISGVLALLMSAFPNEPAERIVARLYRTATGAGDVTTRLTGHGVAQPVEALQRPLTFDDSGAPESSETNNTVLKAQAPRAEADVLADTRRDAVWWGLAGGGALVVAMLLRPVLARRRTGER